MLDWSSLFQVSDFNRKWGKFTLQLVERNDAAMMIKKAENLLEGSMDLLKSHEGILAKGEYNTFSIMHRCLLLKLIKTKQRVYAEDRQSILSAAPTDRQTQHFEVVQPAPCSDGVEDLIDSETSIDDIVATLANRGCKDLTPSIDLAACGQLPYAGGGYCDVYRGKLNDGTAIAIKSLRVYDGPTAERPRRKILKHAARELYHWVKLQHPNVLPLLGLSLFRGQISMVSEWMENGNLTSFLEVNQDADRIRLCMDVFTGLCYIHAKGMANIIVSSYGVAMIADFGCTRLKDMTLRFTNTTPNTFSVRWAAPELLNQNVGSKGSKMADVYAYGMTVLEVLTGEVPFATVQDTQVMFLVAIRHEHPPQPESIDNDVWEILVSCWDPAPDHRPSITTVSHRLRALIGPITDELLIGQMLGHLEHYGRGDITSQLDEHIQYLWASINPRKSSMSVVSDDQNNLGSPLEGSNNAQLFIATPGHIPQGVLVAGNELLSQSQSNLSVNTFKPLHEPVKPRGW